MAPERSDNQQNTNDNESNIHATYAGAKRRIAALELQLEELRNTGTKRKSCVPLHLAYILIMITVKGARLTRYPRACYLPPCLHVPINRGTCR